MNSQLRISLNYRIGHQLLEDWTGNGSVDNDGNDHEPNIPRQAAAYSHLTAASSDLRYFGASSSRRGVTVGIGIALQTSARILSLAKAVA
jgi:hypothetical protein